jgi:hypothetical protein
MRRKYQLERNFFTKVPNYVKICSRKTVIGGE